MPSILITEAAGAARVQPPAPQSSSEWDLDVSFIESGEDVDKLIYMTDDGCGSTCASACPASCH